MVAELVSTREVCMDCARLATMGAKEGSLEEFVRISRFRCRYAKGGGEEGRYLALAGRSEDEKKDLMLDRRFFLLVRNEDVVVAVEVIDMVEMADSGVAGVEEVVAGPSLEIVDDKEMRDGEKQVEAADGVGEFVEVAVIAETGLMVACELSEDETVDHLLAVYMLVGDIYEGISLELSPP